MEILSSARSTETRQIGTSSASCETIVRVIEDATNSKRNWVGNSDYHQHLGGQQTKRLIVGGAHGSYRSAENIELEAIAR